MYYFKNLFFVLWSVFFVPASFAGGVLEMVRVDTPSKKIIFFNECHKGFYTASRPIKEIAQKQGSLFNAVFSNFDKYAPNISFYLEANRPFCENLVIDQKETGKDNIFENDRSFFDQFLSSFAHGKTWDKKVGTLENFDEREEIDCIMLFFGQKMTEFIAHYKTIEENTSLQDLKSMVDDFLEIDEYEDFLECYQEWFNRIEERIEKKLLSLSRYLNYEQMYILRAHIEDKRNAFNDLKRIKEYSETKGFLFVPFLLTLLEIDPHGFKDNLKELVIGIKPLKLFYNFFEIANVVTDLALLEKILCDPKPFILVYGGGSHCSSIAQLLAKLRISFNQERLSLVDPTDLGDNQDGVRAVNNFIFKNLSK